MHESDDVPLYVLDLHGETIEVGNGYWVTMRMWRVPADEGRPHGLKYALSLHAPGDRRIIGYDNAHKPPVNCSGPARRSKQVTTFDHVHRNDVVKPYEFKSPADLLIDFWRDVEAVLAKEGVP